ncbi:MAG: acyl-CoA thioesterase [Phyllobacteriaceae bacterium]|jgi:4-hydroxybenzoyl-CoA thioesterase|nr:acyl-CoA thioesterase [Phyllobacteriaceae bacterium]
MTEPIHRFPVRVSFGDCDPAGIAYYPNILSWLDRAFHDWLWGFSGHDALCHKLDAVGIGLMDVSAKFVRPIRNGDDLTVTLTIERWQAKALVLAYEIRAGDRLMATGRETRGLFAKAKAGMIAADMQTLRAILEPDGDHRQ